MGSKIAADVFFQNVSIQGPFGDYLWFCVKKMYIHIYIQMLNKTFVIFFLLPLHCAFSYKVFSGIVPTAFHIPCRQLPITIVTCGQITQEYSFNPFQIFILRKSENKTIKIVLFLVYITN